MSRAARAPESRRPRATRSSARCSSSLALAPSPRTSRSRGPASRCGTGTTTTSARGASPQGLGYSDDLTVDGASRLAPVVPLPRRLQRASSRSSTGVLGAGHAVAALANALVGAALAVVTWALARARPLAAARARRRAPRRAPPGAHPLRRARDERAARRARSRSSRSSLAVALAAAPRARRSARSCSASAALVRPQALLCAPLLALVVARRDGRALARRCASPRVRASRSCRSCRGPPATAA